MRRVDRQLDNTLEGMLEQTSQETSISRYDRQELIEGWDQSKLESSTIMIIGSDILTNYVTLNASSLGFGNIEVFGGGSILNKENYTKSVRKTASDYSQGFMYYESQEGESRVNSMADISKRINPDINIKGINLDLSLEGNWAVVRKPSLIIDASNSPSSKLNAAKYAGQNHIPFISASTSHKKGGVGILYPDSLPEDVDKYFANILFTDMEDEKQGDITSMVISAIAVDEARKSLMLLQGEQKLEDIIIYNQESHKRFNHDVNKQIKENKSLSRKHIMQIGAGSLGNFTALGLTLRDVGKFTIIDDDVAEETNLNRQPFLYGGIDEPKVDTLVEKMSKINPRIKFETIQKRVSLDFEPYFKKNKPDLIVDTVDNNKTRALLNYFSLKYNIPYISGGTRYNSGQAIVSIPGKTACLNCKSDIDKMALDAYTPQSCILAPTPSVITSNQIIGGLMVGEAEKILAPRKNGQPSNSILKYISGESLRMGLLPAEEHCNCHKPKSNYLTGWVKKMKHLYEEKK